MQIERYSTRDRSYGIWHRSKSISRFLKRRQAAAMTMADLDSVLFAEYDYLESLPCNCIVVPRNFRGHFIANRHEPPASYCPGKAPPWPTSSRPDAALSKPRNWKRAFPHWKERTMAKLNRRLERLEAMQGGKGGVVYLRHPPAGASALDVADFEYNLIEAKSCGMRAIIARDCAKPYSAGQNVEVMPIVTQYLRLLDHTELPPAWSRSTRPSPGSGAICGLTLDRAYQLMTGGNAQ